MLCGMKPMRTLLTTTFALALPVVAAAQTPAPGAAPAVAPAGKEGAP